MSGTFPCSAMLPKPPAFHIPEKIQGMTGPASLSRNLLNNRSFLYICNSFPDIACDSFPWSFSMKACVTALRQGFAGVLKLVDKPDLGSGASCVWVRLPSPARTIKKAVGDIPAAIFYAVTIRNSSHRSPLPRCHRRRSLRQSP